MTTEETARAFLDWLMDEYHEQAVQVTPPAYMSTDPDWVADREALVQGFLESLEP